MGNIISCNNEDQTEKSKSNFYYYQPRTSDMMRKNSEEKTDNKMKFCDNENDNKSIAIGALKKVRIFLLNLFLC